MRQASGQIMFIQIEHRYLPDALIKILCSGVADSTALVQTLRIYIAGNNIKLYGFY